MDIKQNDKDNMNTRIAEIERLINDFREKFEIGTSNADNYITLHEIERLWGELQSSTNSIYSDMIRELMSNVDESQLIRKKKENTNSKE